MSKKEVGELILLALISEGVKVLDLPTLGVEEVGAWPLYLKQRVRLTSNLPTSDEEGTNSQPLHLEWRGRGRHFTYPPRAKRWSVPDLSTFSKKWSQCPTYSPWQRERSTLDLLTLGGEGVNTRPLNHGQRESSTLTYPP